ncbi:RNA methyltransferase [Tropicimonas sediminicola]|uniref:tRNA/rRNA methyltransferase n=1 Tax=Tropicimonas sediminicola TaxID=1031541 RepID=A0A239JRB5_9RHOB|nr:RNA methyltransferase [Tropicimonas sediminicola]SNT08421.1 tRNA/rRNA methyltransferase [Tropicimonas sediminicola]
MSQPTFILVRPQMGENIGGAARAMWNFGLDRMRLVSPRDGWPNPRAVALASGAGRLLDNAGHFDSVADAIGDCTHVYATTARVRGMTKPVLTPEAAMAEARAVTEAGGKVGVMFGPERAGLENEDVARAHAIITVPVNPEFFSLNLAQCVLLTAYEWRRQTEGPAEAPEIERATAIEVEKLGEHFEQKLDDAGFFFPETKAPGMKLAVRNMLSRLALTRADVQIFHGMLRQLTRQPRRSQTDRPDE